MISDFAEALGPGLAPYWANDGDGQYVLRISGIGSALFLYERGKLMNDGTSAYVWYAYKRKAIASPADRSMAPDARVTRMKVGNYPYASTRAGLLNWNELDPAIGFKSCSGGRYNASITVMAGIFGLTFNVNNCEDITVTRDFDLPSRYAQYLDQGAVIGAGERELGYSIAWKAKGGTAGSQHDVQSVRFRLSGDLHDCSSEDANRTG